MVDQHIPTVNVTARFHDQSGKPVIGAVVTMQLTTTERFCGYVVPREARGTTDASGKVVLKVWPNALGTEASEYRVLVTFPDACKVCGTHGAAPLAPLRTIRGHASVPNADCELQDIMELPPYEQRGAGQVVTDEVAAYAAAAGSYADAAGHSLEATRAVETRVKATAVATETAMTTANESANTATAQAERTERLVGEANATVQDFKDTVLSEVQQTASRLTSSAVACIEEHKAVAMEAMEARTGDALAEATTTIAAARTETLEAVANTRANALDDLRNTGREEQERLREEASLYGEDFENLTERALAAAKRSGCSAASAWNAASKACACADEAEQRIVQAAKDLLTEQLVSETLDELSLRAVDAANKAELAAESAEEKALETKQSTAQVRDMHTDVLEAQTVVEEARVEVKDIAQTLQGYNLQAEMVGLSAQFVRLSQRVTALEVDMGEGNAMTPGGVVTSGGAVMAPVTLVKEGGEPVPGAAITVVFGDFTNNQP